MSAAYNSRSAFIEAALRAYLARKQPAADNELARINQYAAQLNREAMDVIGLTVSTWGDWRSGLNFGGT